MDYLPLSDVRTDPNKPGVPQWHIRWTTSSDVSIGHNVKAFVKWTVLSLGSILEYYQF